MFFLFTFLHTHKYLLINAFEMSSVQGSFYSKSSLSMHSHLLKQWKISLTKQQTILQGFIVLLLLLLYFQTIKFKKIKPFQTHTCIEISLHAFHNIYSYNEGYIFQPPLTSSSSYLIPRSRHTTNTCRKSVEPKHIAKMHVAHMREQIFLQSSGQWIVHFRHKLMRTFFMDVANTKICRSKTEISIGVEDLYRWGMRMERRQFTRFVDGHDRRNNNAYIGLEEESGTERGCMDVRDGGRFAERCWERNGTEWVGVSETLNGAGQGLIGEACTNVLSFAFARFA